MPRYSSQIAGFLNMTVVPEAGYFRLDSTVALPGNRRGSAVPGFSEAGARPELFPSMISIAMSAAAMPTDSNVSTKPPTAPLPINVSYGP